MAVTQFANDTYGCSEFPRRLPLFLRAQFQWGERKTGQGLKFTHKVLDRMIRTYTKPRKWHALVERDPEYERRINSRNYNDG
jgi:hypothetical protein